VTRKVSKDGFGPTLNLDRFGFKEQAADWQEFHDHDPNEKCEWNREPKV
jgi:hypothetical protein